MKTVSVKRAKDFLGIVITAAQKHPVTIEQDGVPVAVVVSPEDYVLLQTLENAYLSQAENELTPDAVSDFEGSDMLEPAALTC